MSDSPALQTIVADLSRAMCEARFRGKSAFVATGVTYPNGVSASVRIDEYRGGYVVSDDGYASQIALTMGSSHSLSRIAAGFAKRSGVAFEKGAFLVEAVARENLPAVVASVANTSARAMERVIVSLEQPRLKRSRTVFDKRLQAAFGKKVRFDLEFRGATGRPWGFDAGVEEHGEIVRLYELVAPSTQAVALANMKILDTQALAAPPACTAALVDYDGTDATLRSILSAAGSIVIAASADVSTYRLETMQ